MALVLADRVRDTTTTTGTGTVTLSGTAPTGYQNFSVVGNNNTTYYTINAGSQWEVGIGTYSTTGPSLSRDTVLSSSSAGALVNFSAGTKDVFITYPSGESVYQDGSAIKAGSAILAVPNGGTGAATLTGYVKGTGTAALTASATVPVSDISGGTALTKTDDTNVTLTLGGSPTTALLAATSITAGWTGQLAVSRGGTGASALTLNGVLYGNHTSAISATAAGTTGQVLVGNTGAAPSWATLTGIGVTSFSAGTTGFTPSSATTGAITLAGTLNVANGGTGATTLSSGYLLKGNGTSAVSASVVYDDGTNVGIGTASPTVLLDVFSATAANLSVRGNSGTNITAHRSSTDATGPNLVLRKSRGTSASPSAVATGDNMGTLVFSAFGGTNNRNIATIASNVEYYVSDSLLSSNLIFSTTSTSTTPTEVMRIDGSGNVGIATASPGAKLDVVAQNAIRITGFQPFLTLRDSSDSNKGFRIQTASGATLFSNDSTGGGTYTERMRIDASGNVAIGMSTAGSRLRVLAASSVNAPVLGNISNYSAFFCNNDPGYGLGIGSNASDGHVWMQAQRTDSAVAYNLTMQEAGGNVGIGTSSPSKILVVSSGGTGTPTNGGLAGIGIVNTDLTSSGTSGITCNLTDPGGTGRHSATIAFGKDGTWTAGAAYPGNIQFWTRPNSTADQAERMRINSSGNVGIGTSNQEARLQVRQDLDGTTGVIIQNRNGSGTPVAALRFITGGLDLADNRYASVASGGVVAADLRFITSSGGPVERMRITGGGDVGIGTSSPSYKLDVSGVINTNAAVRMTPTNVGGFTRAQLQSAYNLDGTAASVFTWNYTNGGGELDLFINRDGGGTGGLKIYDFPNTSGNPTNILTVEGNGNVGIGTASPTFKLETIINTTSNVGTRIQNQNTTQYAGSGLAMCGPSVGAGAAIYYYNSNSGGTVGAVSLNRTDVAGNYQATLFNYDYSAHAWQFFTNGSERMRITAAGNVGIGTSSPGYKLDVTGQTLIGNGIAQAAPSTTDIASTSHVIVSGQGGNALFFGQYPGAQGFAQWIQSSFLNPTTATYNLILQPLGGSVGIGTNSPNARLSLGALVSNKVFALYDDGTNQYGMGIASNQYKLFAADGAAVTFGQYNRGTDAFTERMRITSGGDVGIGASSLNGKLHVETTSTGDVIYIAANTGGTAGQSVYVIPVRTAGTLRGGIQWNGTNLLYNNSSDARLKENVFDADDAASLIDAIQVRKFDWKESGTHQRYGFIAQELVEVAPEAVHQPEDEEEMMGVDYSKLVPMMIKEMQSMRARIAELEGK